MTGRLGVHNAVVLEFLDRLPVFLLSRDGRHLPGVRRLQGGFVDFVRDRRDTYGGLVLIGLSSFASLFLLRQLGETKIVGSELTLLGL